MRAIKLSMTAFGPYRETQIIDFQEIGNESIFLITGPTGAGKTTIFDAICYALYGRASGNDRDHDSLRSHFAEIDQPTEVSFQFALKGRMYQVNRFPKQKKRKERGDGFTEDPARAELYEVNDGETVLVASKIKDVNEMLEEQLGLDYEQFRKMIMIPQGEFRRLISENSKEREEILQKIFHTHFYEQITEELKKQSKQLLESIERLENRLEQEAVKIQWRKKEAEESDPIEITIEKLNEEIHEVRKDLEIDEQQLAKEKSALNAAQEAFYKGKQLSELFAEFDQLQETSAKLTEQQSFVNEKQKKLELAEAAAKIIPFEEQVKRRKSEWENQISRLNSQKTKKKETEEWFQSVEADYKVELDRESEREQLKEQLETAKKQLEQAKHLVTLKQEQKQAEQKKQAADKNIQRLVDDMEKIRHQQDKLQVQVQQHQEKTKKYYQVEQKAKQAEEQTKKLEELLKQFEKLQELRQQYQQVHQQYNEKQQLIEHLQTKMNELEAQQVNNHALLLAQHLKEDCACPVCGSEQHPDPASGRKEDVSDSQLEEIRKQLETAKKDFDDWQKYYIQVKSDGQAQRSLVDQNYQAFKDSIDTLEGHAIEHLLESWNQTVTEEKRKMDLLYKEIEQIEQASRQSEKLTKKVRQLESEMEELKQSKETITESWMHINMQVATAKQELSDEEQDPLVIQKKVSSKEKTLSEWMQKWENLQSRYQAGKEKLQELNTIIQQQRTFAKETEQKLATEQAALEEKIEHSHFPSIEAYQSARITESESLNLKNEIEEFNKQKHTTEKRLQTVNKQLDGQEKPDIEELEASVRQCSEKLEAVNQNIQNLKLTVKSYEQIRKSMLELLEEKQMKAKQYYDIGELADLARGENHLRLSFERYVLSAFLDEILLQANIRLDQMTDHRYQLIRSDQVAKRGAQSGLDLEVLDHHTGLQRSVKTLSGGEGFKAALSLALGMADVVQAHAGGVQLETLFIDEGFGTLDELSLEQAIECLKGLQQSNRLLGIISHVPQLKEEIPAKLQITPSQKGSKAAFQFA
ncbi:AAA family ATPase [Sediminibacillus dalangtanensis]|uniref:Nuclease SbcCD subunit C n=1 Tax=Sediminibacillus dalangtanensis TaxID=2729421 RepID=A0ABX7VUZ7_9BACI|nr:AAA family ATPase [Sediminibacillus dalangtanensis]QTM99595.1 AAA family ATPase [Sediminibacillus dalangtanensis]